MATGSPRFGVVQLEVPGELGPGPGRWVVRGHANQPSAVVVLQVAEGPRRRVGPRRRRRRDGPATSGVVPLTRATVADAEPLGPDVDARRWLGEQDGGARLRDALAALQHLLDLHAIAAERPGPVRLDRDDLLRATLAVATGDETAAGIWTVGLELDVLRGRGVRRSGRGLEPDQRLADLLAGRDAPLATEALLLRAEADLATGRDRTGALQLRVALEAAIAELEPWRGEGRVEEAIEDLRGERDAVAAMARATLRGGLDAEAAETARRVAVALRRAMRRRTAVERRPPPSA